MDFQSLGAGPEALFQSFGFPPAPVLIIDAAEIQQCKRQEPAGMSFVQCGECGSLNLDIKSGYELEIVSATLSDE